MNKQSKDREQIPPGAVPRESDNPIVEEFKEELLHRPAFGARPVAGAAEDAERLARLEGLLFDMQQKMAAMERRIEKLEGKI